MTINFDAICSCITPLSIIIGGGWALWLYYKSQEIQKAHLYKELEFKAISLFLEAAKNPYLDNVYIEKEPFDLSKTTPDYQGLEKYTEEAKPLFDYTYSILNVFEVMFNLQKRRLVTEEIFLTWVSWYWDFTRGAYPKWIWKEAKWNYSSDFIEAMDHFFGLASNKKGKRQAYEFLDRKGMIRYSLEKWFKTHDMNNDD